MLLEIKLILRKFYVVEYIITVLKYILSFFSCIIYSINKWNILQYKSSKFYLRLILICSKVQKVIMEKSEAFFYISKVKSVK